MDVVHCRRMIGAAFLLSTGLNLWIGTGFSAEPPEQPAIPMILPGDAPVERIQFGGVTPRIIISEEEEELLIGDLQPIPSNSSHWETDKHLAASPFQDALVMPAEYQPWNWQEDYVSVPEPRQIAIDVDKVRTDKDLAKEQNSFRELVECGLLEQANRVLKRMERNDRHNRSLLELDIVLHDAKYNQSKVEGPKRHVVGYEPTAEPTFVYRELHQRRAEIEDWTSIRGNEVSFHFHDASISDVASYFHHATGLTVRLEILPTEKEFTAGGVFVRCKNKSIEQSLRVVLGSRGLGYLCRDGELVIASPEVIKRTLQNDAEEVETWWLP